MTGVPQFCFVFFFSIKTNLELKKYHFMQIEIFFHTVILLAKHVLAGVEFGKSIVEAVQVKKG